MELPAIGGALSHHRIGADQDADGNNVQAYASANTSRQRPPPSSNQLQPAAHDVGAEAAGEAQRQLRRRPVQAKDKTSSILIRAREYVKFPESKLSELEEKNRELEARLASSPAVVAKNDEEEGAAPPEAGGEKDKTSSILIRAREYVKFPESKLSELEEKNRELEARLASSPAVVAKNDEEEGAAPPEAGGENLVAAVTGGGGCEELRCRSRTRRCGAMACSRAGFSSHQGEMHQLVRGNNNQRSPANSFLSISTRNGFDSSYRIRIGCSFPLS
ncbi:hypothetical protein OsI_00759 [Oryza sativa Indica Group]|uniref:Uncharacterized protein n=1 Tax=Oryza sativa subsp. indica TaxID=39946 RepID=B8ADQ7_ORYSI|nr:hypothetical protein OsI_00759 [Oryza sativa Indica Group]